MSENEKYLSSQVDKLNNIDAIPSLLMLDNTGKFEYNTKLNCDLQNIKKYCSDYSFSIKDYFTSVFSLTLRCFTGQNDNFMYIFNKNDICVPLVTKTSFIKTSSYIKSINKNLKNADKVNNAFENLEQIFEDCQIIYFNFGGYTKHTSSEKSLVLSIDIKQNLLVAETNNLTSEDFIKTFSKTFLKLANNLFTYHLLSEVEFSEYQPNRKITKYKYLDLYNAYLSNVKNHPGRIFLQSGNDKFTYKESSLRVSALISQLKSAGVKEGDTVALFLSRSTWFMISMLAILRFGASYVPVDDKHPNKYAEDIMNKAACKIVITDNEYLDRAREISAHKNIINVGDLSYNNATLKTKNINFNKDLTACILFTSGSTGKPKGVCIKRDGIANLSRWLASYADLKSGDIFGMAQSLAFSAHLEIMFSSLYAGTAIDILPEEHRYEPKKINNYIKKNKITCLKLASPLGREFIKSIEKTNLRFLLLSGAQLGPVKIKRNYRIVDEYGSTENTAQASAIDVIDKFCDESIGYPIWNTELLVTDNLLRVLPPYAKGYLYTAGRGVSKNYLKNKKLTDEFFLPNPYCNKWPFDRLYKTGDCAYSLPNGEICYLGRDDDQVKIRGCRIELSEVENCIRNIKEINEVAVVAIKRKSDYELIAYVQTKIDQDKISKLVKNYVLKTKPKYMVPAFVVSMKKLPLNVNGKIDRKSLSKLEIMAEHSDYVSPQTKEQKLLCKAYEDVLGVEKVGINDDFINLGGDSLSAIEITGKLQNLNISIADIIQYRTPKTILDNTQDNKTKTYFNDVLKLKNKYFNECMAEYKKTGVYQCDLTNSQYNIYIAENLNNFNNGFNQAICAEINRKLDVKNVKNAINTLCDIFPILNSRIKTYSSSAKVICDTKLNFVEITCNKLTNDKIVELTSKNIDLSKNVGSAIFIKNKNVIILALHHIVTDYTANAIIKNTLTDIINGSKINNQDLGFIHQSCYDKAYKQILSENPANIYFENLFSVAEIESSIKLPYDTFNDTKEEYVKKTYIKCNFKIKQLSDFCKNCGITIGSYLTSVFGLCLSKFTFEKNVEFSVLDFGRHLPEVNNSVGYFVNTIPYLCKSDNDSVINFLKNNSSIYFDCLQNYAVNFQKIAKQFNLNHYIEFTYNTSKINSEKKHVKNQLQINNLNSLSPSSDLVITAFNTDDTICVSGEFSNKYSDMFIKRFMYAYQQFLNEMMLNTEINKICYTNNKDIDLINKINNNFVELKRNDVIDGLIENIANNPSNRLVIFENLNFTYGQSACIINKLQKLIQKNKISSQSVLAVLVPRSHWYFFCATASLCANCVYVPIDETYPDERISFMLQDSGAVGVFVTDETYDRAKKIIKNEKRPIKILNVEGLDQNVKSTTNLEHNKYNKHDSACILYTSGSTGVPKGNIFTRLSLINLNEWYVQYSNITSSSVYAQYSSFVFDMHTYAFFSVVLVGGSVAIVPTQARLNMSALYDYFKEKNITHTAMPTQVGKLFLQAGVPECVKHFAVAGEALGKINSSNLNFILEDFYGPTESNVVTGCKVKDKLVSSSIGWLVDNVGAYILDENKNPVPFGAAGELYLTGKQLVKGYLNRPNLNKSCFIKNPFNISGDLDREYMYKTGDVVRFLPDNSIDFLGRSDSQVKIRGNRVELTEVESCIRELDCIKDATIHTVKNNGNKELVAYVVPSNNKSKDHHTFKNLETSNNTNINKNTAKQETNKNIDNYKLLIERSDEISGLVHSDVLDNYNIDITIPINSISEFCNKENININDYILSAYSFTVSRFIYSDKVFLDYENETKNGISITPFIADCTNMSTTEFINKISETVQNSDVFTENDYSYTIDKLKQCSDFALVIVDDELKKSDFTILNNNEHAISCIAYISKKQIKLSFRSNRIPSYLIDNFSSVFNKIVFSLLKSSYLKDISYLEQKQIEYINACNSTSVSFQSKSIIDNFNEQLTNQKNNVFIKDENFTFTYKQSANLILQVSNIIINNKIKSNSNIAIFTERSAWFVLGALSVLAANCTYVPIDISYPPKRICFMLKDVNAQCIIVSNLTLPIINNLFNELPIKPKIINTDNIKVEKKYDANPLPSPKNNEIACILYTSGTTGTPKGSLIKQSSIINFASWMRIESNMNNNVIFGMFSSFVFDAHIIAFYPTLLSGGSIVIIPEQIKHNLNLLSDFINKHNITHTYFPAQVAKTFIDLNHNTTLKDIITGGEAVGNIKSKTTFKIIDAYGPTECCVATNCIDVKKKIDGSSIGKFMPNCKGYILDTNKNLAPVGAIGELYLSSIQTIKGYLNREDENKKAFHKNPYSSDPCYSRLYKTSDIVRYLNDGTIGYVGRKDSQVKIRGNRVELSEVEQVIAQISFVESVVATTLRRGANNVLVVYVVYKPNTREKNPEVKIKEYVSNNKPDYMVPSHIVSLDSIPLNVNGKVDYKLLPNPDKFVERAHYAEPTNTLQKKLCKSFEKVLNIENIGLDDDFINLGGDSLASINLMAILKDDSITMTDVVKLKTPRRISEYILKNQTKINLNEFKVNDSIPLSEAQLNVYLDIVSNNKNDAYIAPLQISIDKSHSTFEIKKALYDLLKVFPILKSRIVVRDGTPFMISDVDPDTIITQNNIKCLNDFRKNPIDFNKQFCKFDLQKSNSGHRLLCCFHHVAYDGLSEVVFKNSLFKILSGQKLDIDLGYARNSSFDKNVINTQINKDAQHYFDGQLNNLQLNTNEIDKKPAYNPCIIKSTLRLEKSLIEARVKETSTTLNAIFVSAFAKTLSMFSKQDIVPFVVLYNGRDNARAYESIGMFVSSIPIVCDCKSDSTTDTLLANFNNLLDATSNSFYPYRKLASKYNVSMSLHFQFVPYLEEIHFHEGIDKNLHQHDFVSDIAFEVFELKDDFGIEITSSGKYSISFLKCLIECFKVLVKQLSSKKYFENISISDIAKKEAKISSLKSNEKLFKEISKFNLPVLYVNKQTSKENNDLAKEIKKSVTEYIAANKPEYMVPSYIIVLDKIPLNINGKVDKRKLPKPTITISDEEIVLPKNTIQKNMLDCVCQVLNIKPNQVGITSNLKNYGLDSLSSIMLALKYNNDLDINVQVADILQYPTIEKQCTLINKSSKFELIYHHTNHCNNKNNLYFIHPGTEGPECYNKLSKLIGNAANFSSFNIYNLFHWKNQIKGIKNIAKHYLTELKKEKPHGPYNLGGWCYGGLIAFEMACMLKKQGEEVNNLFLLDSFNKDPEPSPQQQSQEEILQKFDKNLVEAYKALLDAESIDQANYKSSYYPGKVTLFQSNEYNIEDNYYNDSVDELEIIKIHCLHDDLVISPYVEEVAKHIVKKL